MRKTFDSAFTSVFNSASSRRRQLTLAMALAAAGFGLSAQAADAVNLKFSSFEPPMANITANVLTPFAKEASAASQGTLQITMFAGGTLGRNPTQQLKLVTDGVADIAWIVLPYTPGRFDDTDVVSLPFLIRNATEASVSLHRLYNAKELAGFDGLKMLALASTPPLGIHGKKAVRKPDDFKGMRVRGTGDIVMKIIESLGGAPVQLAGGQVAESMARGVVDLTLNNWGFVGDFKVNEVTSEHFAVPLGATAVGVVMRQDRFDALPKEAQQAIEKASGEMLARRIGEAFDRQEVEVSERVGKSGRNNVVKANDAQLAEWKQVIDPVSDNWRKGNARNESIYQKYNAELQRVRAGAK